MMNDDVNNDGDNVDELKTMLMMEMTMAIIMMPMMTDDADHDGNYGREIEQRNETAEEVNKFIVSMPTFFMV